MATYAELQAQIKELQDQAEAVRKDEVANAIGQINALMEKYGLTVEALQAGTKKVRKASTVKGEAKYRNPTDGTTWTGQGRKPQWLKDQVAAGKTEEEFLIK